MDRGSAKRRFLELFYRSQITDDEEEFIWRKIREQQAGVDAKLQFSGRDEVNEGCQG